MYHMSMVYNYALRVCRYIVLLLCIVLPCLYYVYTLEWKNGLG